MGTIEGTAREAMAGPVVITGDNEVYYVRGLAEWPEGVAGKNVRVDGQVKEMKLIPDPGVSENGAVSAGAEGMQMVIILSDWKVISD